MEIFLICIQIGAKMTCTSVLRHWEMTCTSVLRHWEMTCTSVLRHWEMTRTKFTIQSTYDPVHLPLLNGKIPIVSACSLNC